MLFTENPRPQIIDLIIVHMFTIHINTILYLSCVNFKKRQFSMLFTENSRPQIINFIIVRIFTIYIITILCLSCVHINKLRDIRLQCSTGKYN